MKLFIKNIFIFLPILLVSYVLILYILSVTPLKKIVPNIKDNIGGHGQSLLRFREASQVKNIDILFIGSSHASQGFDNRIFSSKNISTFNMGSGLQTPQNSYYLLKQYVPNIKPKSIIMELYWDVLEYENGNEACIDITSNSECSLNLIKMNLSTYNFKIINSMVANYISRATYPLNNFKSKNITNEKYISGGYFELAHNDEYVKKTIANLKPREIKLQEKQLLYLNKIINYCKTENITLLFVTAPVSEESLRNITNYSSIINKINGIMRKNNTQWLNFNDVFYRKKMNLKSVKDFNDGAHLSNKGVVKFNNLLIEELKKISFTFRNENK